MVAGPAKSEMDQRRFLFRVSDGISMKTCILVSILLAASLSEAAQPAPVPIIFDTDKARMNKAQYPKRRAGHGDLHRIPPEQFAQYNPTMNPRRSPGRDLPRGCDVLESAQRPIK
jgi:hypothetical protein